MPRGEYHSPLRRTRFDVGFLLDRHGTVSDMARHFGVSRKTVRNWLNYGVNGYTADEIAVNDGSHPSMYWPEWMMIDEVAS
jgi:transposase